MPIIGRGTALDGGAALGVQVLQRSMDIDFIQEFPDDIIAFTALRSALPEHSETEANGLIEDLNQHQSPRRSGIAERLRSSQKACRPLTALEAFPDKRGHEPVPVPISRVAKKAPLDGTLLMLSFPAPEFQSRRF